MGFFQRGATRGGVVTTPLVPPEVQRSVETLAAVCDGRVVSVTAAPQRGGVMIVTIAGEGMRWVTDGSSARGVADGAVMMGRWSETTGWTLERRAATKSVIKVWLSQLG